MEESGSDSAGFAFPSGCLSLRLTVRVLGHLSSNLALSVVKIVYCALSLPLPLKKKVSRFMQEKGIYLGSVKTLHVLPMT